MDSHSTQLRTCHKLEMHHTQRNILNIFVLSHVRCKNIVHYDHTSDQLILPDDSHSLKHSMVFSKKKYSLYISFSKYIRSQVGNPKCSALQTSHLSPPTLSLQKHFPPCSVQVMLFEPSLLQSHARTE